MFTRSLLALVALLTAFAGTARAQTVVTPDQLVAKFKNYAGKKLRVDGKFKECWGGNVYLLGINLKLYVAPESKLAKSLTGTPPKDTAGRKLTNKVSNVLVTGRIVDNSGGAERFAPRQIVFIVEELVKTLDDQGRFGSLVARVKKQNPADFKGIHEVARQARLWAMKYGNGKLQSWANKRDREALELHGKTIAASDFKRFEDLAELYIRKLGDKSAAIKVLDRVNRKSKEPVQKARTKARLEALEAYYYRGRWIPYLEYKKVEGYLERTAGKAKIWVRPERAEFLDVVAGDEPRRKRGDPPTPRIETQLARKARKGQIVDGMRRSHLVAVAKKDGGTLGFPSFVDRTLIVAGAGRRYVYDQWIYPDGRRFYLVNDSLFKRFEAKAALPKK